MTTLIRIGEKLSELNCSKIQARANEMPWAYADYKMATLNGYCWFTEHWNLLTCRQVLLRGEGGLSPLCGASFHQCETTHCARPQSSSPGGTYEQSFNGFVNVFFVCVGRSGTTAEKLRGPRFGSQHRSACAPRSTKGRAGCWARVGVAPRCKGPGYHPRKICENSNSCILVTTCCEISCFL